MAFDKTEIMSWSAEQKRALAFELLDSIDEQTIRQSIPEWKEKLIRERIEKDNEAGNDVTTWHALRDKYYR